MKKNGEKIAFVTWRTITNGLIVAIGTPEGRRKRKWGRINISRENSWKFPKIDGKYQPTN